MSDYRGECNERKAVQIGMVEQRPVSGKNGKDRPVVVEFRYQPHRLGWLTSPEWRKWKAYRTEVEAQCAMGNLLRKHPTLYEFRLRGDLVEERKKE